MRSAQDLPGPKNRCLLGAPAAQGPSQRHLPWRAGPCMWAWRLKLTQKCCPGRASHGPGQGLEAAAADPPCLDHVWERGAWGMGCRQPCVSSVSPTSTEHTMVSVVLGAPGGESGVSVLLMSRC